MPDATRDLTVAEITRRIQAQPPAGRLPELLRPAAVLVPLVREAEKWRLLFTRRAETLANHKGQVSFPGGAVDPADTSPEETALREAHEEIGLLPGDVRILGRLAYLQTVSKFLITPVLGLVRWPYEFRLSPLEVSRVFTIPLDWLADPGNREERPRALPGGTVENVIYYQPYDGEILWGASARITVELLMTLGIA
jgi:8-oxo-dGTP pyrophosphatase MutT (NUDIX family)